MIDYSKWKESQIAITNLCLDPKNPRIPNSGEGLSQRDLLSDLVQHDKVYDLAKSIVENGYYPVESLIIVEEDKKKYVLEGNRRLAALKLLLSPESAPSDSWKRRFRALSNRIDHSLLKKVRTVRAPSRESAAPVIMSKHTRNQVESWEPLMQAKFYHNLLNQGLGVVDIADQYRIQTSEITDALQLYSMYSIACSLDLPEDTLKMVQNPREFPATNLKRLYKNPKVIEFLGISFDENKEVVGSIDINEFKKGYKKIVSDIALGKVHSRNLNTTKAMEGYLSKFNENSPNLNSKGAFDKSSFFKSSENINTKPKHIQPPPKKIKKKLPSRAIIPESVSCDVNNQRINDIFNELKKLPVAQYPNAVALMFRSLLEMSLGYYLERTGNIAKITNAERTKREQKNQNLPSDWHPTLTEMLQYVINKNCGIINNGNIVKALSKLVAQKTQLISIDSLNLLVHNQHFYPNEDKLREFWTSLHGLFEIILVEPEFDDIEE